MLCVLHCFQCCHAAVGLYRQMETNNPKVLQIFISSHSVVGQTAIKLYWQHLLFWFGHMQNVVINSFFWTKYNLALIG